MDKEEPCIVHEAYVLAKWALNHLSNQSTQQQPILLKVVDNWWGCPRCKIRFYRYKKDANNCCR